MVCLNGGLLLLVFVLDLVVVKDVVVIGLIEYVGLFGVDVFFCG